MKNPFVALMIAIALALLVIVGHGIYKHTIEYGALPAIYTDSGAFFGAQWLKARELEKNSVCANETVESPIDESSLKETCQSEELGDLRKFNGF
jgi:hypothetical protein